MDDFRLETTRLILRSWRDDDVLPFASMSADPRVMATLGPLMSAQEAEAMIGRLHAIEERHGHTFWALERKKDGRFLGFCGLVMGNVGPIDGKIEIGWRLAHDAWGQGYAREAAEASLDWGFSNRDVEQIWAITTPGNVRSWGLMERLGLKRHPQLDFAHPKNADDSPLKQHITYSIARPDDH
ncbi:GNAT family N-acetyltransferase [Aquisediminimonas profunda]|uniref:GNAT family N-acetyltransferase n=1 Tax=Aquisediminimonas profunda TaxID=1550733 RepID=UPI001C633559|nr:GNAT family N-acetyltransferase [Aquisediminimonas profunda]